MQIAAVNVEPDLGPLVIRAEALNETPEPRGVIHLGEMRDLMGREVIEDKRRREDQPPGI